MQVCAGKGWNCRHDKICYEENYCPLCEANKKVEELKREVLKLKNDSHVSPGHRPSWPRTETPHGRNRAFETDRRKRHFRRRI